MTIDESEFEKASLLPNRWYVILRKLDEDSFAIASYDTTADDDQDFYEAGTVVTNGVMELIESDFERVVDAGLARLAFNEIKEDMLADEENEEVVKKHDGNNVVKVDFGAKQ